MKLPFLWSAVILCSIATSQAAQVSSPSGRLVATVASDARGDATISVTHSSGSVLLPSRMGVIVDGIDYGRNVEIGVGNSYAINESYPWLGQASQITNQATGLVLPVKQKGSQLIWSIEVRAYDEGVAWRYLISGEGKRTVSGELSEFRLPEMTQLWGQGNTHSYGGIARKLDSLPPVLGLPLLGRLPSGAYVGLAEAQTMHYSGMSLRPKGANVFQGIFEDDKAWTMEGTFSTPWRVCLFAETLNGWVNNMVVPSLCPPPDPKLFPEGAKTDWLQPGRSFWQWWAYNDPGTKWERQKGFVDRAAELNCQFYLVDEGWQHPAQGWFSEGRTDWDRMEELCAYAKTKGVKIWAWAASRPDSTRNWPGLETPEKRAQFFANCARVGVAGVKIDFIDSESQAKLAFYEDCLRKAGENKLMVNFHGANKPAGEARTWPNEMTREGIYGLEQNKWAVVPPEHYSILVFTRAMLGASDFTPTTFRSDMARGTSQGFQLASALLFYSPVMTWADSADYYLKSPALELIRTLPTVWDETRILPGSEIGGVTVMARRLGSEWWVAGINPNMERASYALRADFIQTASRALLATDQSEWEMKDFAIKGSDWEAQQHGNATQRRKLPHRIWSKSKLILDERVVRPGEMVPLELEPAGGFMMRLRAQ